jgi:hypothetical protein
MQHRWYWGKLCSPSSYVGVLTQDLSMVAALGERVLSEVTKLKQGL